MKNKNLKFNKLLGIISKCIENVPDTRQSEKVIHSIHDVVLSAFSIFYFKDPSILQYYKRLMLLQERNNLKTIFKIGTIPSDSQLRETLDRIESYRFFPVYNEIYKRLQRGSYLKKFQFLENNYLFNIDGTQYFSSDKINCPHCLVKEKSKGEIRYHHMNLQGTIVNPDMKQVIPFAPEQIANTDGSEKQDCELNASLRLLDRIKKDHPRLSLTINGDGLYSNNTMVNKIKSIPGYHFIFVAKEENHKSLFEDIEGLRKTDSFQTKEVTEKWTKGKTRQLFYSWINGVPLTGQKDAAKVNYFDFTLINENGKKGYSNTWVTDIPIDETNIEKLVRGARSRWKIENEVFNIIKNHGYHIEHNFGHGKENLAFNFFLLNLLAFYWHQIFELTDPRYQYLRSIYSKREMWEFFRNTIKIIIFEDWDSLVDKYIEVQCPDG